MALGGLAKRIFLWFSGGSGVVVTPPVSFGEIDQTDAISAQPARTTSALPRRAVGVAIVPVTSVLLAEAPVAYWEMDALTGTSEPDLSGNGHALTYAGAVTLGQTGLATGDYAAAFDGSDTAKASVTDAQVAALQGTSAFSIEAWLKTDTLVLPNGFRIGVSFPGQTASYLGLTPTGAPAWIAALQIGGVQRTVVSAANVVAGHVYHLAVTYDGANLRLWVDGVNVATNPVTGTIDIGAGGLVLVGNYAVSGFGWLGSVNRVALYGAALTAAQIATHYWGGRGAVYTRTVTTLPRRSASAGWPLRTVEELP